MERAQHTARLIDAALGFMLDQSPQLIERRWQRTLRSLHVHEPRGASQRELLDDGNVDAYALAHRLAFDASNELSIFSCVRAARENARQVREEISGEMWECLNRLYLDVREARPALEGSTPGMTQVLGGRAQTMNSRNALQTLDGKTQIFWRQPHEFFSRVQRSAFEFEGATDATMRHEEGWLFIQIGRGLEQAAKTTALLNTYFSEPRSDAEETAIHEGNLKWTALLKSCAAFEPYCRAYSPSISPNDIAQFLLLDATFPRSVRASALRIETALHSIARATRRDVPPSATNHFGDTAQWKLTRLAGRLKAQLDYAVFSGVMEDGLSPFLNTIQEECVRIHYAIYHVYIGYMAE